MIEISNEVYHGDTTRISKSGLDEIAKSPAHYYARYLDPNRELKAKTPALVFGTAIHTAILQPDLFPVTVVVAPVVDRRSNAGKAQWAEFMAVHGHKTIISADEYQTCLKIQKAVRKHPAAATLLKSGVSEKTFQWEDPVTGAPCKCRPDWISTSMEVCVDLKSTEDASPRGFGRSAFNYRYHVQAPFYVDGLLHADDITVQGFVFIAFEKQPPYSVAVYYTPKQAMELGREIYIENCQTYMDCKASGLWPGYGDDAMALELPGYAFNKQ